MLGSAEQGCDGAAGVGCGAPSAFMSPWSIELSADPKPEPPPFWLLVLLPSGVPAPPTLFPFGSTGALAPGPDAGTRGSIWSASLRKAAALSGSVFAAASAALRRLSASCAYGLLIIWVSWTKSASFAPLVSLM